MKWVLTMLLIFNLNYLLAQDKGSEDSLVFMTPLEIVPKWTEGTNQELIQDIRSKINFPRGECLEGIMVLQFKVDALGKVKRPKIVRSLSKNVEEQLLKIILDYEFEPGFQRNKRVECTMNLPFRVKLE